MVYHTNLNASLVTAYQETEYHVASTAPFIMKVGVNNPDLLALYKAHQVTSAAFMTAYNPYSEIATESENVGFQTTLALDIDRLGFARFPGEGKHPSSNWPPEPSFLVLGISLEAARSLGTKYQQNAIIWCDATATPELVFLR